MSSETSVGIDEYTTPGAGFRAITKQRYSDFIVREVGEDGTVVRLTSLPVAPAAAEKIDPSAPLTPDAEAQLAAAMGAADAGAAAALHFASTAAAARGGGGGAAMPSGEVVLARDDDKDRRREIHRCEHEHQEGCSHSACDQLWSVAQKRRFASSALCFTMGLR